jgi:predicted AlkP superfamily phosphohydrolase/phosphomutase
MRRRAVFAILALAALVIGCDGCRAHATDSRRVIVLGFDGMDYRVTAGLMARGLMPNFTKLAASGSFSSLATTMPPQSPVAWSSFITGLDPGGHGIFDFIHRDPSEMTPYLSTARTEPPAHTLTFAGWQLPLSGAKVTLLRDGRPFWDVLEQHGVRTTIIRMPANFPPSGLATRELSGMGTPDLLGTYGTFTFFSSAPPEDARTLAGGRLVTVDVIDHVVRAELTGPDHPYRTPARALTRPFAVYLDPDSSAAKLAIGDEVRVLKVGEWSDWVPIDFPLMPLVHLRGICRFYLKQVAPAFELYASPINMDPMDPAMPISVPASYAGDLARASGRFYTQGLAEDTKSLNEHILTRDEYLHQAALVGNEILRQYSTVLDGFTNGFLFYYFGNLDQVSHMMWRARDPGHPAYDAVRDPPYARVIDDLYIAFDRIVGDTMRRAGPDATVIVVSDHGFASWRRSFHLNSWLRDQGYLAVTRTRDGKDAGAFGDVDWANTRAYGLGLNGLYINVRGRERWGQVDQKERAALVEEIRHKLLATIDPATGRPVVTKALAKEQAFHDSRHLDDAPDLFIGYAEGTRVSNESALGGIPAAELVDNIQEWSGDHCMDPDAVPGILLTSRPLHVRATSLDAVARAILAEFGISGFPGSR